MPVLLAFPVITLVVIGVMCLLLYLAYPPIRQYLVAAFDGIPAFGRLIGGSIAYVLDAAWHATEAWFRYQIGPLVGLFSEPAANLDAHVKANVNAHQAAVNRDQLIANTLLPAAEQRAATAGIEAAGAVNARLDNQIIPAVETAVSNLLHGINDADLAILNLQSQVTALGTEVNGPAIHGALAGLEGIVAALGAQLGSAQATLTAQAGGIQSVAAEAAGAYTYTDTQVAKAIQTAEGTAAALAASLVAPVAAEAATALQFVDECGTPMCDWFHGPPSGLGSIFGAVDLAALMALVAGAIADPSGAAAELRGLAGEVENLGTSILGTLGITVPA